MSRSGRLRMVADLVSAGRILENAVLSIFNGAVLKDSQSLLNGPVKITRNRSSRANESLGELPPALSAFVGRIVASRRLRSGRLGLAMYNA